MAKPHKQKTGQGRPGPTGGRALIAVDARKLRAKALRAHAQAERALDKLVAEIKRFHERDVPGFRVWLHRTFGQLLTRQRELHQRLAEQRSEITAIMELAERFGLSDAQAWRKYQWRRANPEAAEREDREWEERRRREREIEERIEAERRRRAEERAARRKQRNPHATPDDDDPFGRDESPPGWEPLDDSWPDDFLRGFAERLGMDPDDFAETYGASGRRVARPHDARSIKEVYRAIVSRLHPDRHGPMSDRQKELWHEAQAAYRRHDLAALHSVLNRCEDGAGGVGAHTPLSLILSLTEHLRKALGQSRREARNLKRQQPWDYENRIKKTAFVNDVRQELADINTRLEWEIDEFALQLRTLERLANRARHADAPRRQRRPSADSYQDEWPF